MTNREKIMWAIGRYGTDHKALGAALTALDVPLDRAKFNACLTDVTNTLTKLTPKEVTPNHE